MERKKTEAFARRTRLDQPSLDEFRKAQLRAKMLGIGVWRDYIPTPSERAEWKRLQQESEAAEGRDGKAG